MDEETHPKNEPTTEPYVQEMKEMSVANDPAVAAAPDIEAGGAPSAEDPEFPNATTDAAVDADDTIVEVAVKQGIRYYYFPFVTLSIIAIEWGIFLWGVYNVDEPELGAVAGKDIYNRVSPPIETYWFITANSWPSCSSARSNTWRLVSYQFAHSSFAHIFGNTFTFALYGVPLELFHPYRGICVFAVHELGVIFSALGYSWLNPFMGLIGSSGGVYSIIGATITHLIMDGEYIPYMVKQMHTADLYFLIYRIYIFAIFVLLAQDLIRYFVSYDNHVAYSGHVSGLILGIFMGGVFALATPEVKRFPVWKIVLASILAAGFLGQAAFLIYHYTAIWPPEPAGVYPKHFSCCHELWKAVEADHTLTIEAAREQYTCPLGDNYGIVKEKSELLSW